MRMMDGNYWWVSMESYSTCDSPKGRVVNCITELQKFKDSNAQSTLGQLTSDRMPVSSSQNEGTCFCPFPTADPCVDSSLMFCGCERLPSIPYPVAVPSCVYLAPLESCLINQLALLLHCGNSFSVHSLPSVPWFQVMTY